MSKVAVSAHPVQAPRLRVPQPAVTPSRSKRSPRPPVEHGPSRAQAGGAAGAALGNSQIGVPQAAIDRDRARCEAQQVLWRISKTDRVRSCKRKAVTAGGNVGVRSGGGAVGFSGLATCSSVWACSVCSVKIAVQRSAEVAMAINSTRPRQLALIGEIRDDRPGLRYCPHEVRFQA